MNNAKYLFFLLCLVPNNVVAQLDQGTISSRNQSASNAHNGITVNVRMFGASGSGATNDQLAIVAARDSIPKGQEVLLWFPAGTYRIDTDVTSNGRLVHAVLEDGASVAGPGVLYIDRVDSFKGAQHKVLAMGDPTLFDNQTIGENINVTNNFNRAGYGRYYSYNNHSTYFANVNGGDIASYSRAIWHKLDQSADPNPGKSVAGFQEWTTTTTPIAGDDKKPWGVISAEHDVVYRGPDRGWTNAPGQITYAGGRHVSPDIGAADGSLGGHIAYAWGVFNGVKPNGRGPSTTPSAPAPFIPKSYNGMLVGVDAIAPNGRGIYVGGSTSPTTTDYGNAPLQFEQKWAHGLRADSATISDDNALLLGSAHRVAWVDGSVVNLNFDAAGAGSPEGNLTAPVGSTYRNRKGGPGTTVYGKESGTGNTGWVALLSASNTGSSGHKLPYLDGANRWAAAQTFSTISATSIPFTTQENVLCYNSTTGLVTYQTWTAGCAVSSTRLKNDISDIAPLYALDTILALKPVTYVYKPEADLGTDSHFGFTAEQVASVARDLVEYDNDGVTPRAVRYQELTPLLVGAIQRLKADNDDMRAQIEELKRRIR